MSDPTCLPDADALRETLRAHVTELLGEDDPDFVADLAATFCTSATALAARARDAAAAGDGDALRAVAHQMRGSALNVGLATLADEWSAVVLDGAAPDAALAATACATDALAG